MITPLSNNAILSRMIVDSPELFLENGESVKAKILQLLNKTSALVQIKGHNFNAQVPPGLIEGDELDLLVRNTHPKLHLSGRPNTSNPQNQEKDSVTISSRRGPEQLPLPKVRAALAESKLPVGKFASNFKEGEILRSAVQSVSGNKVVLLVKGESISFKTAVPLQAGSSIDVEVLKMQPRLLISISNTDEASLSQGLKRVADLSFTMSRILQKSGDIMSSSKALSPVDKKVILSNVARLFYRGQGADALKAVFQLFQTPSFSDLSVDEGEKSLMDTLLKLLKPSNLQIPAKMSDEMEGLFKNMENVRQNMPDGLFPIPFLFKDELGVAGLWYEKGKPDNSGKEMHSFTLSIDLSMLGLVEAQVKARGKSIVVQFRAEKKEAQYIIKKNMELLKSALNNMDLSVLIADVVKLESNVKNKSKNEEEFEELSLII